ncbi:MAG: DsbA family protein [Pseudomonadota bacterium]
MTLTRRHFAALTAAAASLTAAPALTGKAWAQMGSELMVPGPLGERAAGAADAPVTIIEYASMTCGHCAAFHNDTYPALKEAYVDTGKARIVMREFPLDPLAMAAFMLAHCAAGYEPGMDFATLASMEGEEAATRDTRYFAVVDALFKRQRQWAFTERPLDALLDMARQIGVSEEKFNACLRDQALLDAITEVKDRGEALGVSATPTFYINGEEVRGARNFDEMAKLIDDAS